MTALTAPTQADAQTQVDQFFTATIIGSAQCLNLGRSQRANLHHGLDYQPSLGVRLADFWRYELENNAWRYVLPLTAPVQRRASRWRLLLERHALRLACVALVLGCGLLIACLVLVWPTDVWPKLLSWEPR